MPLPVTFRQAAPTDLVGLLALIRAYYHYDAISLDETALRRALIQFLNDSTLGRAWFAEIQGQVGGYIIATFSYDLEFGGRTATVTDLYVQASYRRQGVGRAAMAFLESIAPDLGVATLELQAERHNKVALAFYAGLGFEHHDRIPMSKRLGGP